MELTLEEWKLRALEAEKRLEELDAKPVGSHHGDPVLTKRDISLLEAHATWVHTMWKERTPPKEHYMLALFRLPHGPDWIKSRLFWRVRSGKAPLKYKPPTCFSCPWYELIEIPGPHATFDTMRERDGVIVVAQDQYKIIGRTEDNKWIVGYGPYRFHTWNGTQKQKSIQQDRVVEYERPCGYIEYIGLDESEEKHSKVD